MRRWRNENNIHQFYRFFFANTAKNVSLLPVKRKPITISANYSYYYYIIIIIIIIIIMQLVIYNLYS